MMAILTLAVLLARSPLLAQTVSAAPEKTWSGSASVAVNVLPEGDSYAQPTIAADRGRLHLELRHNYEGLATTSAWLGCSLSGGTKVEWEFAPMVGGVFGDVTGIAPGFKGSLRWWKVELYGESEYVIDTTSASDSFFYNWSELSLAPVEWFRFGVAAQRTRVYQTDREVQPGLLVGFAAKHVTLTGYVFNPDAKRPTWVLSAGLTF